MQDDVAIEGLRYSEELRGRRGVDEILVEERWDEMRKGKARSAVASRIQIWT